MPRGSRIRGYATMALGALVCGALGAAFDQLTVTLSPEYFTFGKGVSADSLRLSAALVGFKGGLPLGALCAGVLFWQQARGVRVLLRRFLVRAGLATLAAAPICALVLVALDPLQVRIESNGVLTPTAADRYLACWGLHIGAYAGPLLSLLGFRLERP